MMNTQAMNTGAPNTANATSASHTEHNLHLVSTLEQLQRMNAMVRECRTNEAAEWGCQWLGSSMQEFGREGELIEYYQVPTSGGGRMTMATVNRSRGETMESMVEAVRERFS